MPQGLQVFYGDGRLIIDAKTRTTKLMNKIRLGTKSGRVKLDNFNGSRMWFFIYPESNFIFENEITNEFALSVTNDGWLSWDYGTFRNIDGLPYPYYFYYGDY